MRIPMYILGVGLIFSVAIATAQTQQQQTPPISPSTPATHVGDGAQTKSGAAAPSTSAPATTGGVAGAASSSTATSPDVSNSGAAISGMSDSDLQSQIQNALSKEPTLSGDSAHANVSGDTIELAGTVGTNKEKITATRIVQSYAGSKKLVNKLTVNGRSEKPAEKGTPAPESKQPPQR
jgi:osmotically-inducible protein OsmY